MKAIVVRQPWASLIAAGIKRVEIRTRRISYRGDLLIVAGKHGGPRPGQPTGVSVAIVRIQDCRTFEPQDATDALIAWRPGLWCWLLADIRACERVPVRGKPGLFDTNASPRLY